MKIRKKLIGVVKRHPDGFGFFIPEKENEPDVYLPAREMRGLMNHDKVQTAVTSRRRNKRLLFGKVLKITKRAHSYILGPYHKGFIKDDSFQWGEDLKVRFLKKESIADNTWIQVKITHYPASREGFKGDFISSLGVFPGGKQDNFYALQKHSIPLAFNKETLREANRFSEDTVKNIKNRKDLREKPFVTIDGQTAQDFDDAVCTVGKKQGWILYTAIADVSWYVRPSSFMDKTAYERSNSTYLPGLTIPMLPEALSNNLCSLKPHKDRLAFISEMHFNKQGERLKFLFYPGVIRSKARLTYGEAQEIWETVKPSAIKDPVKNNVMQAGRLAQVLLNNRKKRQFIDLNIPETEIKLNAQAEPVDIIKTHRLFSHQMIEELMLAVNQSAAEYIYKKTKTGIYRVHDPPKKDSLELLESFAENLSQKVRLAPPGLHKKINLLMNRFADHPAELILQNMVLRSLSQAVYKAEKKLHFGLNFKYYTHFTSPIRRYSDLIVHRILRALLTKHKIPYNKEALTKIAVQTTAGEQRSVKAERLVKDIKKARFIKRHLGREMQGMICSVVSFGFFVKLKLYDIEGLVALQSLAKGPWLFERKGLKLKSRRTGHTFQIGDFVKIQVLSANISTGQVDFKLIKKI